MQEKSYIECNKEILGQLLVEPGNDFSEILVNTEEVSRMDFYS